MRFIKFTSYFLLVLIFSVVLLIVISTITDYKPAETELIAQNEDAPLINDSIFSALIWNIGYAGLSAKMDFFYDGGKQVRPDEKTVDKNLKEITSFLKHYNKTDFVILQEVDEKSKRSYNKNEISAIKSSLADHSSYFAYNYKVAFVPLPPSKPMGRVSSGLLSFSKARPAKVERHSFPGNYSWPKNLFMLDRCFLVSRFSLKNKKELLVINTHNSAYDDGTLRDNQMNYLKSFLLAEYKKGNYIVVGGDWNQSPPNFVSDFMEYQFDDINYKEIPNDYLPKNWNWAYVNKIPTNRRVDIPFNKGTSRTTVIDFYLLSPNIKVLETQTIDIDFSNSDHQPVYLSFKLL